MYWGHGDVRICHDDHCLHQARCGDFHSIKWYKENRRVYVYSPVVDFSKVRHEKIFSQTDKNMLYLVLEMERDGVRAEWPT